MEGQVQTHSTLIKSDVDYSKKIEHRKQTPQYKHLSESLGEDGKGRKGWNHSEKQMRFLKSREEERITWVGFAGVTSTDQRQEQIKATEMLGRNRWTGPGPGRK